MASAPRRLLKEQPLGAFGGIVILLLVIVSVFAGVFAPYEPDAMHLVDRLQGPSVKYLLGTDHLGRDYLSRLIHGARVSLTVGLAATTVNVVVAVLIGGTSGSSAAGWTWLRSDLSMPGWPFPDCCCC